MFCSQCGLELSAEAKFCSSCGAKVIEVKKSSNNKNEANVLDDYDKYDPNNHEKVDKLALNGDYKGAIKFLSRDIQEAVSSLKRLDLDDERTFGTPEFIWARYTFIVGLISRAKLFYLLGDYNKASEDIEELFSYEEEFVLSDTDCFDDFNSPSLIKVCKKLEKEGYDLPFDIDDIRDYGDD